MNRYGKIMKTFGDKYILEYNEAEDDGSSIILKDPLHLLTFKTREEAEKFAEKNNINLPENR